MADDRRKHFRHESTMFVQIETQKGEKVGRGVVLDMSQGGIGVETETDLPIGETYICRIEVPFTFKMKTVRRYADGQMKRYGFQITNLGFFDKLLLKRILKGEKKTQKV